MISASEAERIILADAPKYPARSAPIADAQGFILREDIRADRDLPPYDRVMMDGIAISYTALENGSKEFPVQGIAAAGRPPLVLKDPAACVQVMTGAVIPKGCDCVIPCEEIELVDGRATLHAAASATRGQFIHTRGQDRREGDTLLKAGTLLRSPQIAAAAAAGYGTVHVGVPPSVAVVANGDELVDVDRPIAPWQIRPSNSYGIQAALRGLRFRKVTVFRAPDDIERIEGILGGVLTEYDILILSGGVSMGEFDYIPRALEHIGVRQLFHKVAQRPGKPFWFGRSADGKPVFALPGNPAASLICFRRYVIPFLMTALGGNPPPPDPAVLSEEIRFEPELTYHPPVQITGTDGNTIRVTPVPYNNSGDLAAIGSSDGFVQLSAECSIFPAGTPVPFYRWLF